MGGLTLSNSEVEGTGVTSDSVSVSMNKVTVRRARLARNG